jgi:hypothetical protein
LPETKRVAWFVVSWRPGRPSFLPKLRLCPARRRPVCMHGATRHCGLRSRGSKRLKAPRNEELYVDLFKRKPGGPLHRALADVRVTLASFIEGQSLRWW